MTIPVEKQQEADRLLALERMEILDTEPEPIFDRITRLAADLCYCPIARISLVDKERLWFKAAFGLDGVQEIPRGAAFCECATQSTDIFEVDDASVDERFSTSLLVTEADIRFYAGAPLVTPQGYTIGTLCVLNTVPGALSASQHSALRQLSAIVVNALENRRLIQLMGNLPGMAYRMTYDKDWSTEFISDGCQPLTGYSAAELLGWNGVFIRSLTHPDDRDSAWETVNRALHEHAPYQLTARIVTLSGEERWIWEQGRGVYDGRGEVLALEGFVSDVTESRALSEQLAYMASHDHLTGLINRREFEVRLERAFSSARNTGVAHALCFLDLDQFKVVNDTCGHAKGDEMLRQLCDIFRRATRSRDTVARLGGDEFVVLMENCGTQVAERSSNAIIDAIKKLSIDWQGRVFHIGVSVGITAVTGYSESVSEILHIADSACYAAKRAGGSRFVTYIGEQAGLENAISDSEWVIRLNQALEEDSFELYMQIIRPLVDRADKGPRFEILLRLPEGEDSFFYPREFYPIAESYHLAPRLDQWVVESVFNWLGSYPEFMRDMQMCCINLSAQSLYSEDFSDFLNSLLSRVTILPEKVCFEITETAAIENLDRATVFIRRQRKLGFNFALDDFGSGLSSFAYLKKLPVDNLKIDRLFVSDIVSDEIDRGVVASVTSIAHRMGMEVTAEGVEGQQTLDALKEIGVDFAQGYHVDRPQSLAEFVETSAIGR